MSRAGHDASPLPADPTVAALLRPETYAHRPASVEHLKTHLSHVFLAPPYAYKLARAVRYSFADTTDLASRQLLCAEGLRLNPRFSPGIYLDALALHLESPTHAHLEPARPDDGCEHVLRMRALPASGMLARALAAGRVRPFHIRDLAERLVAVHRDSPAPPEQAALHLPERIGASFARVLEDARPAIGVSVSAPAHEVLTDHARSFVHRHEALLRKRVASGCIRHGHGDLHAGNLCLIEADLLPLADAPAVPAGILPFDCLEFAEDLRCADVAAEVAFLVMDLAVLGHPDLGRVFARAYVRASGDHDLLLLLPYYVAYRASVRGLVSHLAAADTSPANGTDRARPYFDLAVRSAWRAAGPAVIAMHGTSGSGKTALAQRLAATTGFRYVSSDLLRRTVHTLDPGRPTPVTERARVYGPAGRARVYAALRQVVADALDRAEPVIADATFIASSERGALLDLAGRRRVPIVFVHCEADDEILRSRLAARATGAPTPAEADESVAQAQRREADPLAMDEPSIAVDTSGPLDAVLEDTLRLLWSWRRTHAPRGVAASGSRA